MADYRRLKSELSRLQGSQSTSVQTGMIDTVFQSVSEFVNTIREEEELVRQISQLERESKVKPTTPQEEHDQREKEELLREARLLKNEMEKKRQILRRLESRVESLLHELRKR